MNEVWYSDSITTDEMILNSFKNAEISGLLDWREVHQFRGYEDQEKERNYKVKN